MTSQAEAPCSISHHARTSGQAPSFFPTKHLFSIEWPTCGPCQSDSVTSNPCYLLPAPAPPFVCISSWCLRVVVVCGQKVILAIACSHIPVLPSGSSKVEGTFRENLNLLRRFFLSSPLSHSPNIASDQCTPMPSLPGYEDEDSVPLDSHSGSTQRFLHTLTLLGFEQPRLVLQAQYSPTHSGAHSSRTPRASH